MSYNHVANNSTCPSFHISHKLLFPLCLRISKIAPLCVTSHPCVSQVRKDTALPSEFSLCVRLATTYSVSVYLYVLCLPHQRIVCFGDIFMKFKMVMKSDATIIWIMTMTLMITNVCEYSINHLLFYHGSFVAHQLHHHRCICLNIAIY